MAAFSALVSIFVLFFVFLLLKEFLPEKLKSRFCVLCAATAATWLIFLIAFYAGFLQDKIIIALLLGGSIVGILYMLWKYKFFLLPIFLTLVSIGYFILGGFEKNALYFVLVVWVLFFIIFFFKNKKIINKIIACCRNW